MIKGWLKNSFIDYPNKIATIIFVGRCNFRCPYCHNGDLVLKQEEIPSIPVGEVLEFLKKRQGLIDGVVISGGEATLYPQILPLIQEIKKIGYAIKLDTNGCNPQFLKKLVELNLLDYIAMDVKNTPDKYAATVGLNIVDLSKIQQSIDIIKEWNRDYEFRTTVMQEFHTEKDLMEIGRWLSGSKKYVLQQYRKSNSQLTEREFTAYSKQEMQSMVAALAPFFETVLVK